LLRALADRFGIRTMGIELSRQEANHASRDLGLDLDTRSLEDAQIPSGSFDLVTSFEVIEHVADPMAFVRSMARVTRPGGSLLIMTDNFESRACRAMGTRYPKWIPHSHISHFALATLRRCIESVPGLRITRLLTFTPWEVQLQRLRAWGRRPIPAEEAFDLEESLRAEASGRFRLFRLRLSLASLWFRLAASDGPNGSLVYVLATNGAGPA
jgi:SAM-dependent methyltransferase